MSTALRDYPTAYALALERAQIWQCDQGIRKTREYSRTVYVVSSLPDAAHSFGADATAQRVPWRDACLDASQRQLLINAGLSSSPRDFNATRPAWP